MNPSNPSYCKIFILTNAGEDEIIRLVLSVTSGSKDGYTIHGNVVEVDVTKNDDAKDGINPADFVTYPYFLDVFPTTSNREHYVRCVRDVLGALRSQGWKVVAACDFVDELRGFHDWADGLVQ